MKSAFAQGVESGQISTVRPMSHGRNGAMLVVYTNGAKGIVKKRNFEGGNFRGVRRKEMHLNELAAYELDQKLFRFGFVPEVKVAYYDGAASSVQAFVEGDTAPDIAPGVFSVDAPDWKHKIAKFFCQVDPDMLARLVVFDLILNNTDRHGRNLIFSRGSDGLVSSGKAWAIDNGNCMGENLAYYRNVFHKYMFRHRFPVRSPVFDLVSGLRRSDFAEVLDPIYGSSKHSQACYARARWVLKHQRALDFHTVSHGRYDKNDFPHYAEELARLQQGPATVPGAPKMVLQREAR